MSGPGGPRSDSFKLSRYLGAGGSDTTPAAIRPFSIATAPHCFVSAFASNLPSAT